jgi:hypothetical protein
VVIPGTASLVLTPYRLDVRVTTDDERLLLALLTDEPALIGAR